MRTGALRFALGLLFAYAAGCATTSSTTKPTTTAKAAPARSKLAVLPVESDSFPKAARALNLALDQAAFGGQKLDILRPKASLEVIQLSIECVEPTTSCYAAVGRSLGVEHVVLSQLQGGAKRRDKQVKIALTLFDIKRSEPVEVASETFADENAAERGIAMLVEKARVAAERLPVPGGAQ